MAGDFDVRITGIEEAKAALLGIPNKLRRRALLNALKAGGRIVRDAARQGAPVLSVAAPAVQKGHRTPGLLRKALSVRTSKASRAQGDVGVFINVRPAPGAKYKAANRRVLGVKIKGRKLVRASKRGAKSPVDPYYWRFVEFGTKRARAFSFLRPAASRLAQALDVFKAMLGPQIQRLNTSPKDPL